MQWVFEGTSKKRRNIQFMDSSQSCTGLHEISLAYRNTRWIFLENIWVGIEAMSVNIFPRIEEYY